MLRMELQLLDYQVVVLRPGAIDTGLLNVSVKRLNDFKESTTLYKNNATKFDQIVNSVESRKIPPEKLAKKIDDVQKKCAEAEKEVKYAKDCDFKGIIFDDQTKAIEYLQDACVALSNSQISTQEALDLFFQYQTKLPHRILYPFA